MASGSDHDRSPGIRCWTFLVCRYCVSATEVPNNNLGLDGLALLPKSTGLRQRLPESLLALAYSAFSSRVLTILWMHICLCKHHASMLSPCYTNNSLTIYTYSAASAVAANIILRSAFAASFPLFARQMFENMKVQWASTLLGCLATMLVPIPFLFRAFGKRLRRKLQ